MNVSFKGEILLSQCMHLLQLVTVVPSSQPWMEKEIIEGKVPIDSVRRGEAFHTGSVGISSDEFSYGRAVSMKGGLITVAGMRIFDAVYSHS